MRWVGDWHTYHEAVRRLRSGESAQSVAAWCGFTVKTVRRWLREAGGPGKVLFSSENDGEVQPIAEAPSRD